MSVFDMLKNKATELLQGAGDKVSEATGIDLPIGDATDQVSEQVTDQVTQATDGLGEAGQNLSDTAADRLGEVTDPGQKP